MKNKNNTKENKAALLVALEQSMRNITIACKAVGISRPTYHKYYNTDEKFRKGVDMIKFSVDDFVENALFKKIKEGDTQAILFYLKSKKGRELGYSEEQQTGFTLRVRIDGEDEKEEE